MSARWAELVARECPQDFKEDIERMITAESKLDSIANLDELMRQRGKVEALRAVLFKVTQLNLPTQRR